MANINENKTFHFIYKTTNLKNGKYYIGMHSTSNLKDGYLGSGKYLRNSIKKHGIENFKCEILEFLPDRLSLTEREKELITNEMIHDQMCMNISFGGLGGFQNEEHAILFHSAGAKATNDKRRTDFLFYQQCRISSKLAWKLYSVEKREKIMRNLNWNGRQHTPETKQKMKDTRLERHLGIGEENSQYGTQWITNGTESKKIKKEQHIPDGWYTGRVMIKNNY